MAQIALLNQETIDKIAAGEVVERPSSVVKELVENSIDAGASAVTVEIKEGGISFIRITDNGSGIEREQVPLAFLRHSTSKIKDVTDLLTVNSLGFRGEALSSISAVARVELITKTYDALTGTRYVIEGSKEISNEEIGAPDGTTFLIKDLFYNTPVRRKFLKTPQTEGNHINEIVEKLALSHPSVSFKFINNNQTKLHTSGNGKQKDLIYHIFGREFAASILELDFECEYFKVKGYVGKPTLTRGNRSYENYFINGRYVKSSLLSKAIEDAYKNFLMQHQYPFTVLYFEFPGKELDVNVHPTKMELRFTNNENIYRALYSAVYNKLANRDLIPLVPVDEKANVNQKPVIEKNIPEPFEKRRLNDIRKKYSHPIKKEMHYSTYEKEKPTESIAVIHEDVKYNVAKSSDDFSNEITKTIAETKNVPIVSTKINFEEETVSVKKDVFKNTSDSNDEIGIKKEVTKNKDNSVENSNIDYKQSTLGELDQGFLSHDSKTRYKIIGQLFNTYWLIELDDKLYIIDQHAAHEKVLYEKTMNRLKDKEFTSQMLSPPIIITLSIRESEILEKYREQLEQIGYSINHFGGKEYMINSVPDNLYNIDVKELFIEMINGFSYLTNNETPELILEKVASMSCKAAVKGNNKLSYPEIEALIDDLLSLDNPYNCPHGRPTIISMSKYDIERKFKRII